MSVAHHAWVLKVGSPLEFQVLPPEDEVTRVEIIVDTFGINDVRSLIQQAYQRPQQGSMQQLLVRTQFITHEAQNALLKVLEEPPQSTKFLFVLPWDLALLPTLSSRLQVLPGETEQSDQFTTATFLDFVAGSYQERLQTIEEKLKKQDIVWQREMKRGLLAELQKVDARERLPELAYALRMLLTRGASNKMLLEHIALTFPVSSQR